MRHLYRRFQSWVWDKLHPTFDEPPRDETTPKAFAAFVANSKHPPECKGGCRCVRGGVRDG